MCSETKTRMDNAHARYATAHAGLLAAIAELEATDDWRGDGAGNLPAWLCARYQVSYATARRWVAEARALKERPDLEVAYASGTISCDQMQALTVVAEPETDGAWVEVLPFWTIDELQREARKTKARELERRDEGRYVRSLHTRDERWGRLEAQLHPEELAALLAAIDQEIPAHARLTDMDRYAADGLMALVRQELGTAQRPDRATVVVHVRAATLRGDDGAAQVASLEAGGYVSEETARRLACDCRAEFVAWDAFTQAVGIARASRVVPPYLYRQLRYRDGCCVFPGCGRTGYLHAHHIVHWALRGKTELDNLVLVCTEHHQLVHEYGWSLRGRAGPHIRWIRPDGTVFAPRVPAYADSS